jgi:two-component system, OmpR family, heavy metal sensor histidine kinase CusS
LFGVVALWTLVKRIDLGFALLPMIAYAALATVAFAIRHRELGRRIAFLMPFFDVALAFVIHYQGLTNFPQFTTSWALSCLGTFTLIVALVGLSLSVRLVVAVTVLAVAAQWLLLPGPSVTLYAMLAATCTIGFVAIATGAVPRIAEDAFRQENQAAVALASLAKAQEQNRQLELLQRERDALLEIIVHDMRSPVGAAMLSLEYLMLELKKQPHQAPLLEAAEDAVHTLNSLSGMIGQILDTAKLESGRITLRLDLIDVKPILVATVRETAARAASRSITVGLEAGEGIIAALDQRLFPRALDALLTHVLRRTPEGGRMLVALTHDDHEVRVSLHSNAPAVPAAEREKIFDKFPFTEGEARRVTGWGLGLYFCRLVAATHQGTILVEDVDGWPTSFVIRLPSHPRQA